jgi:hypothetical protein
MPGGVAGDRPATLVAPMPILRAVASDKVTTRPLDAASYSTAIVAAAMGRPICRYPEQPYGVSRQDAKRAKRKSLFLARFAAWREYWVGDRACRARHEKCNRGRVVTDFLVSCDLQLVAASTCCVAIVIRCCRNKKSAKTMKKKPGSGNLGGFRGRARAFPVEIGRQAHLPRATTYLVDLYNFRRSGVLNV